MTENMKIKNLKDGNRIEQFDIERLHKSVLTASLSCRRPIGQSEATATAVCEKVAKWLQKRPEVTSGDIRRITAKHLEAYDPEAAYSYTQQHLII